MTINLSSRERIVEAMGYAHITDSDGELLLRVADAYISGRLVDREAIDYEAAARELVRQIVLPANAERYVRQEAPVIVANSVVDAAIGDTDE